MSESPSVDPFEELRVGFTAAVSHELRTPLTSMMGYVEMLRLGMLDERGRERALEVIERNTQTLTQLVGDVLDTSRIVSGKMRLHTSPLDLHTVIGAAVDVMRPAVEAKGLSLHTSLDPNEGLMTGDAARLQQVVTNLLSNAVKFTPKGGEVSVSLRRVGLDVEVTVSDTGQGIAPEFLPRVFERFWQAEGGASQRGGQTGLGLGLAIVRHIVEMHGGTVSAESAGLGNGATFRVRLPLTDARAADTNELPSALTARAARPNE
jgi:signal transduction histidine kinase